MLFFMPEYNFLQRKKDVLKKKDKSFAKSWDKKILKLCKKINSMENYYTTSSCSGRVLLMVDQEKKGAGLFLWTKHEKIKKGEVECELKKLSGNDVVKFKCEPPIIHVVCKTLNDAEVLLEKGFRSGFKNSGIISIGKNIVVEIHGTEKLEFPVFRRGKILVSLEFLEVVRGKSNKKLEKGWEMIEKILLKI